MGEIAALDALSAGRYRDLTFPRFQADLQRFAASSVGFGLSVDGAPAGLAWASISRERRVGEVRSLQVLPPHRRQHWATRLMQRLEEEVAAEGIDTLLATYATTHASTPYLERLFERMGWEEPTPQMLMVTARLDRVWQSHWVGRLALPPEYEVFAWAERSEADAASIRRRHAQAPWIAPDLNPFDFEADCDPRTSLGLRHRGEVVGWVLTHVTAEDTLRYTCSYLHPDLQKMARLVPVYEEVMRRSAPLGLTRGTWTVPYHHPRMVAFVTRWIAPFADAVGQTRSVRKRL